MPFSAVGLVGLEVDAGLEVEAGLEVGAPVVEDLFAVLRVGLSELEGVAIGSTGGAASGVKTMVGTT